MIEQFYKAYNNTIQMLVDRKYISNEEKEKYVLPIKDFIIKKNRDINLLNIKNIYTRDKKPVIVLFFEDDLKHYKTKKMILEFLSTRLSEEEIETHYIICVYQSKEDEKQLDVDIVKKEKQLDSLSIQFFPICIMSINRLNNHIMPQTELLTDKDAVPDVGKSSMNVILSSDPLSRYYGANPGDIFKVIRKSANGPSISWRRVA